MANRIASMRNALVKALKDSGTPGEWSHISKQVSLSFSAAIPALVFSAHGCIWGNV
jgi:aspartate/tyrosine/aromatic aminotransferase